MSPRAFTPSTWPVNMAKAPFLTLIARPLRKMAFLRAWRSFLIEPRRMSAAPENLDLWGAVPDTRYAMKFPGLVKG